MQKRVRGADSLLVRMQIVNPTLHTGCVDQSLLFDHLVKTQKWLGPSVVNVSCKIGQKCRNAMLSHLNHI